MVARCLRCARPGSLCLCGHARPVVTRTRVVILQHPRERDVPIGTARLAELSLPSAERHLGVDFTGHPAVHNLLTAAPSPMLLFPGPGARPLSAIAGAPRPLIVIDGTWSQARKLLAVNPALASLPRYTLPPGPASAYRIRKSPTEAYVSTIEAIVRALRVLEPDRHDLDQVLAPFEALVAQQLRYADEARDDSRRRQPRPRPRLPAPFSTPTAPLLVTHGEVNTWPRGHRPAPPQEVLHWVAQRLPSGETFEAVIQPVGAVSPSFLHHAALPAGALAEAEPYDAFAARWARFVDARDVPVSWGHFAASLARGAHLAAADPHDLRVLARRVLGRAPGSADDCARALGTQPGAPPARGRAGLRLATAVAVARGLRRSATHAS